MNRRQTEPWEIDALDQLRHGDPTAAWHAYRAHDRVLLADTPTDVHTPSRWTTGGRRTPAGEDGLLLAGTRRDATALNQLARQHAAARRAPHRPDPHGRGPCVPGRDRVLVHPQHDRNTSPDGRRCGSTTARSPRSPRRSRGRAVEVRLRDGPTGPPRPGAYWPAAIWITGTR